MQAQSKPPDSPISPAAAVAETPMQHPQAVLSNISVATAKEAATADSPAAAGATAPLCVATAATMTPQRKITVPTAAVTGVIVAASAAMVTPQKLVKRQQQEEVLETSSDEDCDDSSYEEVIQPEKPPAAKRHKRSSKKKEAPIFLTNLERKKLEHVDSNLWLPGFQQWLLEVDGVSQANMLTVMSKTRILVSGEGMSYNHWPEGVIFNPGVEVNLSMDFDAMLDQAKAHEERYGEDKGHGWLLRHPINKLRRYQSYVVVEKLRKGKEWPGVLNADEQMEKTYQEKNEHAGKSIPKEWPVTKRPGFLVGTKVYKDFGNDFGGWFWGRITKYEPDRQIYRVDYEDDDWDEMYPEEVAVWVEKAKENLLSAHHKNAVKQHR